MDAKEYIINCLQKFVDAFKNARARYNYDILAQSHTIEISPLSVFESDEFLDWEGNVFDEFVNLYPSDAIGFIPEDALVGINSIDYSVEGIEYAPYNTGECSFGTHTINLLPGFEKSNMELSVAEVPNTDFFVPVTVPDLYCYNDYKLAA